jgi:sugar O-acyltransferase (sialic acid O-acetyltransferase NeuD family)
MQKTIYAIYGASGFGKETMPIARLSLAHLSAESYDLVFIDDGIPETSINGYPVMSFDTFNKQEHAKKNVSIAIANSAIRLLISQKLKDHGISDWDIKAHNTVILDQVTIGKGVILAPFVALTSNITIGNYFHANLYSYVAHDCVIGNYVTLAPGVKCNGNVHIGDRAYIGTGAIIKQGSPTRPLKIGKDVTIAAGAFVTKNVPDGVTVIGSPAKILSKESLRRQ